ncbi:ComF family protein [Streptomyces doudnae]|uniref:ComF family protein n=1 Tax=Streptomyces doudnae TaxID=3075536 RepID=A0ABD5EM42_9ACTN|nr:ComF family protein [Streptomyces sp. DSM 41981]MDT0435752.1 ComF family protein [Streptomyces sp. DSM 41981]
MRGLWRDLTDLVLPTECGGCGAPRTALCPECRAALSGAVPGRVRPVTEPPGLPPTHAAARYADAVRALLLAHKERGALGLCAPLGAALAAAVRSGLREAARDGGRLPGRGAPVLLVPVPSARAAVRARGHDPARRIALAAAGELRRTGTPARVLTALVQRRTVADQAGLDARQRSANLAGALTVVPGAERLLRGGPVVLVDDLMTTGASLTEAARAVTRAAARTEVLPGWAVYEAESREGRGERTTGSQDGEALRTGAGPEMRGTGATGTVVCAAVVAAAPDSLGTNRN